MSTGVLVKLAWKNSHRVEGGPTNFAKYMLSHKEEEEDATRVCSSGMSAARAVIQFFNRRKRTFELEPSPNEATGQIHKWPLQRSAQELHHYNLQCGPTYEVQCPEDADNRLTHWFARTTSRT